jgi:histidine triad (HIT) family protein
MASAKEPNRARPASGAAFTERGSAKPCAFCAVIRGEAPAHVVYRDDDVIAFLDQHPLFKGHTLLAPVEHVSTYDLLPDALSDTWMRSSKRLQRAVEAAMESDGSLLIVNNVVSQSVPHLHLHVIPRSRGDGLRFWLGPRTHYEDAAEATAVAQRIATAYAL